MFTLRKHGNLYAMFLIAALLALAIVGAAPVTAYATSAQATTWYVAPSGKDTNSCTTTAAPCLTIDAAIGKAAPSGDTIKVALGTYTTPSGGDVVSINKAITISGGWDGTFAEQIGLSVVDGQDAGRGISIGQVEAVSIDHFKIQHGNSYDGGGIASGAPMAISYTIITQNTAEGIFIGANLTIDHSNISYNGSSGISSSGGFPITLTNSMVDDNGNFGITTDGAGLVLLDGSTVSNSVNAGIRAENVSIRNGTVSGTAAGDGIAGYGIMVSGKLELYNATITNNQRGIYTYSGPGTLTNSIVAGNRSDGALTPSDCQGTFGSGGFNIIGSADSCTFTATTGDQVGTDDSPIDPKLGPLADHAGPTFTHALLAGSPAINAGNATVEPGSGGSACLATDQRGFARPALADGVCDIGAYELLPLGVSSITRTDPETTSTASVGFSVLFNDAVVGVDAGDFALTTTQSIVGASITSVTGSGSAYVLTANAGSGVGTIRLDLIDDDGIVDAYHSEPLGGVGSGNGNFTAGEAYTIVYPSVVSVMRASANPTSAANVVFSVKFSSAVSGVNTTAPFSDFHVTTTGLTGAAITSVSGSGASYKVNVNRGTGSGTLRLDVIDDGSIVHPDSGNPLGGDGPGNGNFTTGQVYSIVAMPRTPNSRAFDTTPTFTWTKLPGVTQYRIQVYRGTTWVYSYVVTAAGCGTTTCSGTPPTILKIADYQWRVQAYWGGAWRAYSPFKAFGLSAPKPGYWASSYQAWVNFYVNPTRTQVNELTMHVNECLDWWDLTYTSSVPITAGRFSVLTTSGSSSIHANGTFAPNALLSTLASGTAGYANLPFPCGNRSRSASWSDAWIKSTQPLTITLEDAGPMLPQVLNNTFRLERLTP